MTTESYRPAHLTATRSDRGFRRLPAVRGAYGGSARVFESSSAEEASLWLNVTRDPVGWDDSDPNVGELTLHLRADAALALAEQLLYLLRQHYHGDQLAALRAAPQPWRGDAYDDVTIFGIHAREDGDGE